MLGVQRGGAVGRWAPRGWGQRAWSWRRGAVMQGAAGAPSQRAFLRLFDFFSIVSIRELIGIFLGMILGVIMIYYHCLGNWISIYELNCVVTRCWIYSRRIKLKAVRISALR